MTPREVDETALWEVAAALGANDPNSDGLTDAERRLRDLERDRPVWMDDDVDDRALMAELQPFVRGG